ncbi:uncharacterized protein LOC130729480 [Lotus japonicus]|uniref:uncharacterized protein LOC130729480 n=1 Tax=Lotus japonicus TaxID=34305 RepID=UPI00258DCCEC|nr:uncharacterized protein LOC130729480 [Lotus japonicus]
MGGGALHVDHLVPQFRSTFNNLSSSSPPPSNLKPSTSSSTDDSMLFSPHNSLSCCSCHSQFCRKMELVDGKEAKTSSGCLPDSVFGVVPSQWEVEDAVSALQEFIQAVAVSSSSTHEQFSGSYDPRIVHSQGYRRLHDALQLLQADPAIKRLVISLSSDNAVWDAVMSHVLHQKLPELPDSGKYRRPQISEQNEFGLYILNWIRDIIKGKILELIESFMSLLSDLFQSPKVENATENATELDEKVRSSLLLSIVILLIVIMARFQRL